MVTVPNPRLLERGLAAPGPSARHIYCGPHSQAFASPVAHWGSLFPSPSPICPRDRCLHQPWRTYMGGGAGTGAIHTQTGLLTCLGNNCPQPQAFTPWLLVKVCSTIRKPGGVGGQVREGSSRGARPGDAQRTSAPTPAHAMQRPLCCPPVAWPPALGLIWVLEGTWKQTCQPHCSTLGSGKPQWPNQFPSRSSRLSFSTSGTPVPPSPSRSHATVWGLSWAGQRPLPESRPVPHKVASPTRVGFSTQQTCIGSLLPAAADAALPAEPLLRGN